MLTQYCLSLKPDATARPSAEWAYRLYAALLSQAPVGFAETAHADAVTPVSQFLSVGTSGPPRWTVNLLGKRSEDVLSDVLEGMQELMLERGGRVLITERCHRTVSDVDELFNLARQGSSLHHLDFRTPTAFKSKGRYLNLPTTRLVLQSLIHKWNGSITDCPIEDEDGAGLDALAAGIFCESFCLRNRIYYLKGCSIPGFTGSLVLENRLEGFHRLLADALLQFSTFAGVGIKTTLGMGGVERRE